MHQRIFVTLLHSVASSLFAAAAVAQSGPAAYLELVETQRAPIPSNCSAWRELYPAYGTQYHQDWYIDNDGDGEISVCDYIQLNGQYHHVEWAGPTYYLSCGGVNTVWEPYAASVVANPVCQLWHRIVPWDPASVHVTGFEDANQDGMVSPCDFVVLGGQSCHIDDIRLNMTVRSGEPVSGDVETWGSVKSRY